jgi:hypothetical protein
MIEIGCALGLVVVLAACSDDKASAAVPDAGAARSSIIDASTAADSGSDAHAAVDRDAALPASISCRVADDLAIEDDDLDGSALENCHDVPRTIIANNCTGTICHYSGKDRKAGLDLMSPCVADRLIDKVSTCQGKLIIDLNDPPKSFILDKLESDKPACGESMPWTGHLPPAQLACTVAWVHSVIRAAQ